MNQTLLCPCCGEELKISIQFDEDGKPVLFLLDKKQKVPSLKQLADMGYEFGVIIEDE